MEAVKHNSRFARKVGIPQSVGEDFVAADKRGGRYAHGGSVLGALAAPRMPPIKPVRGPESNDALRSADRAITDARSRLGNLRMRKAKGGKIKGIRGAFDRLLPEKISGWLHSVGDSDDLDSLAGFTYDDLLHDHQMPRNLLDSLEWKSTKPLDPEEGEYAVQVHGPREALDWLHQRDLLGDPDSYFADPIMSPQMILSDDPLNTTDVETIVKNRLAKGRTQ